MAMAASAGLKERWSLHILCTPLYWKSCCHFTIHWKVLNDLHCCEKGKLKSIPFGRGSELHFNRTVCTIMKNSSLIVESRELMIASNKQEQIRGYTRETEQHASHLVINAKEEEKTTVDDAELKCNVVTSSKVEVVYTRRSRRCLVAKDTLAAKKSSENGSKGYAEKAKDVPLEMQNVVTKGPCENLQKEKPDVKYSQHLEMETLRADSVPLHKEEKATIKGSGKHSQRKKASAKASQKKEKEMVTDSEQRETKIFIKIEDPQLLLESSRNGAEGFATKVEDLSLQGGVAQGSGKWSRKRKTESQHIEMEMTVGTEKQESDILFKKVDPWLLLVHKKALSEWTVYNPLTMRRPNPPKSPVKLLSWNVNGLRALLKGKGPQKPGFAILELAEKEDFDVLCLQETKLQEKDVSAIKGALVPGYENSFWSCSTAKLGYSGTAVVSRIKPLSVSYGLGISNHDNEGRIITVEYDQFFLVTGYIPNSGQKLERLVYRTQDWDVSLSRFLKDLEKTKPVILTGDLNCAHQEIDIYNPDGNRRSAGFTNEERSSFEENFLQRGLIDTFRRQHPNVVAYTYWGYRTAARPKNQGWRLDYFLASDALIDHIHDSYILPDVEGSDHCPIGLILKG